MRKQFCSIYFIASSLSIPVLAEETLDESRLWLPKGYERQYLDLKEAAEAALKLDRCVKVMRGTIDMAQSTKEHPIFRIQCRQSSGRTYNEMVDGLSKETLTTVEVDESQDENALEEQEAQFWTMCKQAFDEKTRFFSGLSLKLERSEAESFSLDSAKYIIEFDAEDMHGQALKYKAVCIINGDNSPIVTVRKRREKSVSSVK